MDTGTKGTTTARCEANVIWEMATALMLATQPSTPVGVAAREAHRAAVIAESQCTCAAHFDFSLETMSHSSTRAKAGRRAA
jgi:hypothetical protein